MHAAEWTLPAGQAAEWFLTHLAAAPLPSPCMLMPLIAAACTESACRVRDNIIAAAEEIGLAACVTSVYSNGSAVAVEQRHAGIAAKPEVPAKPSTPSDGFMGDGKLVLPDYPGGQTMQLFFDIASSAQCRVWDGARLAFVPEGAPKGKAEVAAAACLPVVLHLHWTLRLKARAHSDALPSLTPLPCAAPTGCRGK